MKNEFLESSLSRENEHLSFFSSSLPWLSVFWMYCLVCIRCPWKVEMFQKHPFYARLQARGQEFCRVILMVGEKGNMGAFPPHRRTSRQQPQIWVPKSCFCKLRLPHPSLLFSSRLMLPIGQQRLEKRTQQQTVATAIKDQALLAQQCCITACIQNYYMVSNCCSSAVNSVLFEVSSILTMWLICTRGAQLLDLEVQQSFIWEPDIYSSAQINSTWSCQLKAIRSFRVICQGANALGAREVLAPVVSHSCFKQAT